MRRTEALQGVRMMRFLDILGRYEAAELNQLEAAALLGVSERTFRRWQARYEEDGEAGFWTGGSARRRGSGFRSTGSRRSRRLTDSVMRGSEPSTSISTW